MTTEVKWKVVQSGDLSKWQWDNCFAIFYMSAKGGHTPLAPFEPKKDDTDVLEMFRLSNAGSTLISTEDGYTTLTNVLAIKTTSSIQKQYPILVENCNNIIIRLPKNITDVRFGFNSEDIKYNASKYGDNYPFTPILTDKTEYDDNWSYWIIPLDQATLTEHTSTYIFQNLLLNIKYK